MAFLELKKYRETSKDEVRKPWLEFFWEQALYSTPRAGPSAKQINCWTIRAGPKKDRKMFSQLRMREEQALLAHDYALEQAEEKRLRTWPCRGNQRGVKSRFSKSSSPRSSNTEVASQQLGMTVAEFEALL